MHRETHKTVQKKHTVKVHGKSFFMTACGEPDLMWLDEHLRKVSVAASHIKLRFKIVSTYESWLFGKRMRCLVSLLPRVPFFITEYGKRDRPTFRGQQLTRLKVSMILQRKHLSQKTDPLN